MKSKLDGRPLSFVTLGVLSCLGGVAQLVAYFSLQNPEWLYCGTMLLAAGAIFLAYSNPLKK